MSSLDFPDAAASITAWLAALVPLLSPTAPVNAAQAQAFASVTSEVAGYLDATAANAFLSTATGPALVALAADRGVIAGTGTPSTVTLTATLTGLQPVGAQFDSTSVFATSGDALTPPVQFIPTGIVTLAPGATSATIPVQSVGVGVVTCVAAGTITVMQNRASFFTSVTNPAPATGGTDPQSDASLLVATQAALAPPGSVDQLQKTAAAQPNIAAAVVIDAQDGAGTVTVYALNEQNTLTGATSTPTVPTPLFVNDTMTGVSGTSITAHVGELGATWTRHTSYATGAAVLSPQNRLRNNVVATSVFYASGVAPVSPEYDVWADINVKSLLNDTGIVGRVVTGANTFYYARYHMATTAWQLFKVVAGVSTQLGADSVQGLTTLATYRLKLQLRNGSQRVLVSSDGGVTYATLISTTDADAALTAKGVAGVYFVDAGTGSGNVTGLHIDQLSAIGPGSADDGPSEALAIYTACLAQASPGLHLQVATLAVLPQNVTVNVVTQVPGSGLTAAMVITAITTYLNDFAAATNYVPAQLTAYLWNVAFPAQLLDVQLSVITQTTVGATQIIRAGTVLCLAGP